jgi:hypothetical protein
MSGRYTYDEAAPTIENFRELAMSFAYKELAQQAAEAERRAQFTDAAAIWNQAYEKAKFIDQPWVIVRIDFCNNAAKNNWGCAA